MDAVLRTLLDRLESIGIEHEELYDSEVRQQIGDAIMDGFIRDRDGYELPSEFGLYSDIANRAVKAAIRDFNDAAKVQAVNLKLSTFHERLRAVQNRGVRSRNGYDYQEFLGHTPTESYDELGNVIQIH